MTAFTVYSFNDAYELSLILNGIRHFIGSGTWVTLAHIMFCVLLVFAILQLRKFDPFTYLRVFLFPILLYIALFVTPCKVNISDQYSFETYTISDVPFGIGAPIWAASLIEKVFIDTIDTYIAPPDTPKFSEVDFFGQARLMAEVSTTNLWNDAPLQQTMSDYFENCVLPQMANGSLQVQQLKTSPDLLARIASNNHALFTRVYTEDGASTKSCAEAYGILAGDVSAKASSRGANSPFARGARVFGSRASNGALASASYDSALSSLFTGQQDSMEALFAQNFLINNIRSSLGSISPALLASISEAESKHFTSAVSAAMLYIKQLPKLRALFKLVLIALFPVVGAFFLVPSGRPFLYWAGCLLWISLWLPAEASIHAAFAASALADLRAVTALTGGYSLANNTAIVKWATETHALAGGMMILIPVLTGMLIRWAFPALGTTIAGMLQGARGSERAVTAAASGSLEGAGTRMLGMERDKFAKAALDFGDRLTAQRQYMKEMVGTYTDNFAQGTFGNRPVAYTGQNMMEQTVGKHTMSVDFTAQDLHQAEASQQSLMTQQSALQRSTMISAIASDLKTGGTTRMQQVLANSTQEQRDAVTAVAQATYARMEKDEAFDSYTNTEKAHIALAVGIGTSLSAGPLTGTADLTGNALYEKARAVGTKFSNTESHSGSVSQQVSHNLGKVMNTLLGRSLQDSLAKTQSQGNNFADNLTELNSLTNQYQMATSSKEAVQASMGHNNKLQLDVAGVISLFDNTGINRLQASLRSVNKQFHNRESNATILKREYIDFTNTFTRAQRSTDSQAWGAVFQKIAAYERAARAQGSADLVEGVERIKGVVVASYAKTMGANAKLDEVAGYFSLSTPKGMSGSPAWTQAAPGEYSPKSDVIAKGGAEVKAKTDKGTGSTRSGLDMMTDFHSGVKGYEPIKQP